jgi:Mn2+/Fe2+ NRAMP family transporter
MIEAFAMWGTILTWVGVVLGVGSFVFAATLVALGTRGRRMGHPQQADDRFRGASIAPAMGAGVLATVGFLNGIPSTLRAVLSIDSETADAINASITAVSLAVIAVCAALILRRTQRR